ncbi:NADH dehydrogenase subunit 7 [Iris pallida]|uniref:NADH dehydrogenase subunit 7 (Mitochondrion) n=1 Tax=Iris pallida TaxID=29817 RepID=A0AAX6GHJ3_IRIPA|nr:NADH dehydrogenase subunit 7 [Iris pallida]
MRKREQENLISFLSFYLRCPKGAHSAVTVRPLKEGSAFAIKKTNGQREGSTTYSSVSKASFS